MQMLEALWPHLAAQKSSGAGEGEEAAEARGVSEDGDDAESSSSED